MPTPYAHLTPEQIEAFGEEMDAIRASVIADLGERDADYIRGIVKLQRALEVGGRASLFFSLFPPAWLAGTTALSLSKIIDNMEIGHNVMHGQYDWMGDPALSSTEFDWDTACPAKNWQHSHNYMHHTHTNIVGMDRDIGYTLLRMDPDEPWEPRHLANPIAATALAFLFEWGVMLHDLEVDRIQNGEKTWEDTAEDRARMIAKVRKQVLKDYALYPALTGPNFFATLTANATANVVRNLWAFTIIFCGHFPDGVELFPLESAENETRGEWYLRQLHGSANITGGKAFHVLTGNLSHQIEHHLFPDLPGHRYAEIAPLVRDACQRYGLPYNTGGLTKQFGSVVRRIVKLALPGSAPAAAPAPEPAPAPVADKKKELAGAAA